MKKPDVSETTGAITAIITPIAAAFLGTYVAIKTYEARRKKGKTGIVVPTLTGSATVIATNLVGSAIGGTLLISSKTAQ